MHKITNKEIEKRAIMEIINYIESKIDAIIEQSVIELEKLNECRKAQGLDPKNRIDKYCIKNAIKTINSKHNPHLHKNAGGKKRKEIKYYKKHLQEYKSFTGGE
jgi:hypothetical protein